jgi:hypothetical protein
MRRDKRVVGVFAFFVRRFIVGDGLQIFALTKHGLRRSYMNPYFGDNLFSSNLVGSTSRHCENQMFNYFVHLCASFHIYSYLPEDHSHSFRWRQICWSCDFPFHEHERRRPAPSSLIVCIA